MTPYAIIRKLNKLTGSTYPTQMGYNYVRNGLIPASKVEGKWNIKETDADAWISKFCKNNKLTVR